MNKKQMAAERAVEYVQDGMFLGLGTGSTVYYALAQLSLRVRDGLRIQGIPTSEETARLAVEFGIPLTHFRDHPKLDLTIDGADAVAPDFSLIKGGGAALLREKLVASASSQMVVVVDDAKLYNTFDGVSIPIEVVPFAWETTANRIESLGASFTLREKDGHAVVTDNHNYILDVMFPSVVNPSETHASLKSLTGVVETGLFTDLADVIVIASDDGVTERIKPI